MSKLYLDTPKWNDLASFLNDLNHRTDLKKTYVFKIKEFTCYITKNPVGAWLAYVDVTDYPELHGTMSDRSYKLICKVLPFHGGCTYYSSTDAIGELTFEEERFLIGCDWCHNITMTSGSIAEMCGVEKVQIEEVKKNLEEVVEFIPELRLKMTIRGKDN